MSGYRKTDRRMPAHKPTLAEPIRWRFFKNRRHDQIVTTLETYEGQNIVSVRAWFTDKAGIDRPTAKGVAMAVRRLPDLLKALNAAHDKAVALGMLEGTE
jgi:Transcriptional Coactivator p15 (PC4)